MENIKIEDNIPIDKFGNSGNGAPPKYPFGKLEVGQSFLIEDDPNKRVRAAAYAYAQRKGLRFITRSVGEKSTRVWRVQ